MESYFTNLILQLMMELINCCSFVSVLRDAREERVPPCVPGLRPVAVLVAAAVEVRLRRRRRRGAVCVFIITH